jgi:hypothetical protein|tara:strand:- start:476 stop:724 length:249 start_codon:yes stop_codon:yes gene_type:complete
VDDLKIDRGKLSDEDIEDAEQKTHDLLLKFFGVIHEVIQDDNPDLSDSDKYTIVRNIHESIGVAMTMIANDLEIKATGKMVN